ncbi:TonB-dependent receptor domain-containing protein [Paenalcaligenes suwonensis]|uniref:TonB-dependent receptor domain-containing protein n=1 Tax=Paenalcaligenes suwonensis TaxID=1202713 RepID=UPI0014089DB0|nr:TonB-dependent receptor [Paenalcaligenes suwonensis]NHC61451.1 TonB-dependent receptor [Paenalcaligenes suwonensis]
MKFPLKPLSLSVLVGLGSMQLAVAQEHTEQATVPTLHAIRISALPLQTEMNKGATAITVVETHDLLAVNAADTLGQVLAQSPGIHSDTFGAGAGRPVIRGQTAPRVKVLSDGIEFMDASAVSPDHAIPADIFSAERIEVLRGPSALLYGGGAIGGVVNIVDNKIPTAIPEKAFSGRMQLQGSSVDRGNAEALSLTGSTGSVVVQLNANRSEGKDYRVPHWKDSRVENSNARSDNMSVGVSFVGDRGYIGAAYSYRYDKYGLPGHTHEYEDCHPHGSSLHCGGHGHDHGHDHGGHEHGHDHDHDHDHKTNAILRSDRFDLRGELDDPLQGFDSVRFRAGYTDYRHDERDDGVTGTRFTNRGYDGRIELQHKPWGGLTGVVGIQTAHSNFKSVGGSENFIPPSKTHSTGLFMVESYEWDALRFEVGARYEWQNIRPENRTLKRYSDQATSLSAGVSWAFAPQYVASLSLSRSQRMPNAQELYAKGVHFATLTYERGNPNLKKETSQSIDVGLRKTEGAAQFAINLFHSDIKNYIYANTLDKFEDFRLIEYSQRDARFTGVEAEASYQFTPIVKATLYGDYVRGSLRHNGGSLARIPAARVGVRTDFAWNSWQAYLNYTQHFSQNRVADYESRTAGYGMFGAGISYRTKLAGNAYEFYVKGSNLFNQLGYNHASFISRAAPLAGRNVMAGVRMEF